MIRPLTLDDTNACLDIMRLWPEVFTARGLESFSDDALHLYGWVVECNDDVAGFMLIQLHPESTEIKWIAVHREHMQHGHGAELLGKLDDAEVVCLLTLGQPPAWSFYSSHGFKKLRPVNIQSWEDEAWVWARILK